MGIGMILSTKEATFDAQRLGATGNFISRYTQATILLYVILKVRVLVMELTITFPSMFGIWFLWRDFPSLWTSCKFYSEVLCGGICTGSEKVELMCSFL